MLSPAQQTYLKQAKNPHMISCRRIGHLDESFGPPFVNHVFFDRENGWIRSLFHRRALNIPRRSGGLVALSVEVFDRFFRLLQPKLLCSTHDKIREGMIRLDEKLIEERGSLGEFSGRGGQIYLSRHTSRNWNRGTIGPLPWASILGSNCGGREMLSVASGNCKASAPRALISVFQNAVVNCFCIISIGRMYSDFQRLWEGLRTNGTAPLGIRVKSDDPRRGHLPVLSPEGVSRFIQS
jgi:hypothetical protein